MLSTQMKYRFVILVFISVLFPSTILSQHQVHKRALKFQELAFMHFRQHDTTNAREFALKAIKKDSLYATPWVLLGNIYEMQSQSEIAVHAYKQALKIDESQFSALFYVLAELELGLKHWNSCIQYVQKYLITIEENSDEYAGAIKLLEIAKFRKDAYEHPIDFNIVNLGKGINSDQHEYVNSLSTDEKSLYITIKSQNDYGQMKRLKYSENIYRSDVDSLAWSNPAILNFDDEIVQGVGGASISPNNRYLFFTSCEDGCNLFYAKISKGKLGKAKSLGAIVNSNTWDSQPCFSSDGKSLFFASKRAGGYGGADIWVSELDKDGHFQKPYNAGATINSMGDEMAPFIHHDAHSLYFSSNGHIGLGGHDLFLSKKMEGNNWSEPKNLGYPINTEKDEINLIVAPNGITAFISTDKIEGFGGFDIYKFELGEEFRPVPVTYIEGVIVDSETGENLVAKVELGVLPEGELFTSSQSASEDGSFLVALPLNKSIALNIEKEGYLMYSEHFYTSIQGSKVSPVQMQIPLQKINLGASMILKNIFFETDKFELMEASFPELKKMVRLMNNNPSIIIEISGHTDNVGSLEYNQLLSERRAKSVLDYLVMKGVSESRLQYKGFGFVMPISTNNTPEGRAKNRRTVVRIL